MTHDAPTFEDLRLNAAREFAQTMIVIDDEASQSSEVAMPDPISDLRRPSRVTRARGKNAKASSEKKAAARPSTHALNAKSLIDKAMDLGLICSVLRPRKGENFRGRVVGAAQRADIVCLDWEIYDDSGESATKIICDIVKEDAKENGKLRLIAIYTGDITNNIILEKIFKAIPKRIRDDHEFKKEPLKIVSKNGLKIVCLFKAHGVKLQPPRSDNQVKEDELPERLQSEFAMLSEGLLSNVALATIASIRKSTHHVLSKFTGQMDGPYFHHRALLESSDDAEEYAVDVVLSELKSAVDKQEVANAHAGHAAIKARIEEIAGDSNTLELHYVNDGISDVFDLKVDVLVKMITDGLSLVLKNDRPPNSPKTKIFETELSSLFSRNREAAHSEMHQFAALTGIRAYPGSYLYKSGQLLPKLGLGTIIQGKNKTYLLCLQASCDSVRIRVAADFLFVPLEETVGKPDHVVPISYSATEFDYIGLTVSSESYAAAKSIGFSACSETGTVNASRIGKRPGLFFVSSNGVTYRWIADLKRRRALRTVQRLGQAMGRLGFDEFEPYRQE